MSNGRYRAYPEYKDSGLPWMTQVPVHWTEARFKHVLADKKKVLRPDLPAGSISFGRVVYKDAEVFSEDTKASYQEVLAGEFLVNPLNLNYDLLSLRTALSSIDVVVSTGYIVLQGTGRLHPNYARWLLQQFDVAHMKTLGAGVRQTINYADIGNSYFFEPPLPEQIQIAKFLDHETAKIDRLIEKQEELIRLLKEKRQAVISHAVTKGLNPHVPLKDSGIPWLGQIPAHWTVASLKFYAQVIDCKHITAEFLDDGFPLASIGEVKGWYVNLDTAKRTTKKFYTALIEGGRKPGPGDIIFTRNATVGEAAIVPRTHLEFAMGQDVCLIRVADVLSPEYTLHVLKSGLISKQLDLAMIGSTFKRINVDDIRNFVFAIPPIEEQASLASEMNRISKKYDRLISEAENSATLLQERRTALISAAVTGKIDVRHWQPPAA